MPLAAANVSELDEIAYPRKPELFVGLVAPIGTPVPLFVTSLRQALEKRAFTVSEVKLSVFAEQALAPNEGVRAKPPYERYRRLMELGNEARRRTDRDDILALYAAAQWNDRRPPSDPQYFQATAVVFDQLKRPEEVHRFRRIYGDHFLLIGLSCPKDLRERHLKQRGATAGEAALLIALDEDDATKHGQRLSDAFHLADVFVEVNGSVDDIEEDARIAKELDRFLDLVFGERIESPTRDEYGMYLAHSAGLRSSSLARQVGAAIVTSTSELIAVGANDIPCYPGGLYWGDERDSSGQPHDGRDHMLGYDESDRMKREIIAELLPHFFSDWGDLSAEQRDDRLNAILKRIKGTRVTSLTEFARAVHAEMEALASAVRVGVSVRGSTLYSTTFPCHNCAKHIVAAGIKRVVYIEPYPKSRAQQMYGDSISILGESKAGAQSDRVQFEPFVGVSPRRYGDLFGRYNYEGRLLEYKNKETGELQPDKLGLRIPFSPLSYVIREGLAARDLKRLKERINAAGEPSGPNQGQI